MVMMPMMISHVLQVLLMLLCVIVAGMQADSGNSDRDFSGMPASRIILSSSIDADPIQPRKDTVLRQHKRYGSSIPAAPVQGEATSCSLDLTNELLGGVKAACMQGPLDKRHCCPVLAAWLMAARAKVALHPPLQQEPGMPLLPDDSLVCIASLKAALAARGISINPPPPASGEPGSCDVVTCFCGIHLSRLTSQSCPLLFDTSAMDKNSTSIAANTSSVPQPTLPHSVQHAAKLTSQYSPNQQANSTLHQNFPNPHQEASNLYNKDQHYLSNSELNTGKALPAQPSQNDTIVGLPTGRSPPSASLDADYPSSLLQHLAANCTDHSYRGCTRCLKTLTKEMTSGTAKRIMRGSNTKAKDCEMTGLMWLLELNKTLYIPTVSAVVRAFLYNTENSNVTKCSLDTDNMPLALDYAELLSTSTSTNLLSHHRVFPCLIISLMSLYAVLVTNFYLPFVTI